MYDLHLFLEISYALIGLFGQHQIYESFTLMQKLHFQAIASGRAYMKYLWRTLYHLRHFICHLLSIIG